VKVMEYNVRFLEKRGLNGIGCKLVPLDWTVGKGAKILEIVKPYPRLRVDASILSIGGMRVGKWEHKRIIDRLNNAEFPINVRLRIKEDYFKKRRPSEGDNPDWVPYFRSDLLGCPGKHDLKRFKTPRNGYKCDSCRNFHFKNETFYDCFECYFLVCEKCVLTAKTGGDPRVKPSRPRDEDLDDLIPQVNSLIREGDNKAQDDSSKKNRKEKKPGHRKSRSALDDILEELSALGPIITPDKPKPKPKPKRSQSDLAAVLDNSRNLFSKSNKGWHTSRSSLGNTNFAKPRSTDFLEREDSMSSCSSMRFMGRHDADAQIPGVLSPDPSRSSSPSLRQSSTQRMSRLAKNNDNRNNKVVSRTQSQPAAFRDRSAFLPFQPTMAKVDSNPISVSNDHEDPFSKILSEVNPYEGREKEFTRERESFISDQGPTNRRREREKQKLKEEPSSKNAEEIEENKEPSPKDWESKVERARRNARMKRNKASSGVRSSKIYSNPASTPSNSRSRTSRRARTARSSKIHDSYSQSVEPRPRKKEPDVDFKPEKKRQSSRHKKGHRRSSSFSTPQKSQPDLDDLSLENLDFDSGSSSRRHKRKKRRSHQRSKESESLRFSREQTSSRRSSQSATEEINPLHKVESYRSRAKQLERDQQYVQAYRAWNNAMASLEEAMKSYIKPRDVERLKQQLEKFKESARRCKKKEKLRRQQKKKKAELGQEASSGSSKSQHRSSRKYNKDDAGMSMQKYKKKITFRDIVGLESVKYALYEAVLVPVLNSDDEFLREIFAPPKGVLLFGNEGSGKTTLGLSLANQGSIPLVNLALRAVINSSSPRHKLRDYFHKAREYPTSMIFIDDLEVLAPIRRRTDEMKERQEELNSITKELIGRIDRIYRDHSSSIFIVSATRSPDLLDKELIRRFSCKLHVPAPTACGRTGMIYNLLKSRKHDLSEEDFIMLGEKTSNFNRYDLTALTRKAVISAHREAVKLADFQDALRTTTPSLDEKTIRSYERWNESYGTIAETDKGGLPNSMQSEADRKFSSIKNLQI